MAKQSVAWHIRDHRYRLGLTQLECSRIVGINPIVWSHWETGVNLPSLINLGLISKALGLDSDHIAEIVRAASR